MLLIPLLIHLVLMLIHGDLVHFLLQVCNNDARNIVPDTY